MSVPGFAARWGRFVLERFPPAAQAPMAAAFFAGNAAAAMVVTGGHGRPLPLACGLVATLLVFLRLRIFDEIKDHVSDRESHPERPLARGLVTSGEAKAVAAVLALAEGLLAFVCGLPALAAWAAVLGFSLLMYREFFVGRWLRPRMELYAVTHTFVAALMGIFAATAAAGWDARSVSPAGLWFLVPGNWAVFNVFEFARKTRGTEEEAAAHGDSYSSRLRPAGAAALALSQVAIGAVGAALIVARSAGAAWGWAALAVLVAPPFAVAAAYVAGPSATRARVYRGVMSAFIAAVYVAAAAGLFLGGGQP